MAELRNHAEEGIVVAIAGNKSDKEGSRQIDNAEAERYARENGVLHFQTSAKTGKGMTEMFQSVAEGNLITCRSFWNTTLEIYKKNVSQNKGGKKKLLLVDDDNRKKKKKNDGCC